MSETHQLRLPGCTPEPLMNYLKALGVLRLVSEQVDPEAVACWRQEQLILVSALDEEGLIRFFLKDYCPTPIIGPWAGGSGFFGADNRKAVDTIVNSTSPRASAYQSVIRKARSILEEEGISDKPDEDQKGLLLRRYRREMPDVFVQWMDAAMVLQSDGQVFAPVLGTGGNDGRLDFTQNFMQRLVDLGVFGSVSLEKQRALLCQSLFGKTTSGLGMAAVGQFSPGNVGGPNATQGFEGKPTDNPWTFALMLEGSLTLAGTIVRRMGTMSTDKAAFPFTVRTRPVGNASPTEDELGAARGELWLPIWTNFSGLAELQALFGEGRAELSSRPVRDAVEFARAVASIGVDRGIQAFVRYGFLKRSGKAYLAAAMDRFRVPDRPREGAGLLRKLDEWMDRFRRTCSAKETPGRLKARLRGIESSVFDYCRYGRPEDLETILIAFGRAEYELAVTGGQRSGKQLCPPLSGLSPDWLAIIQDGSTEVEVALAIAGIYDRSGKVSSGRTNIEPVVWDKGRWVWQESGPHVVWKSACLPVNMAAVLARRMMDGARAGSDGLPLDFKRGVSRDAVAAFIAGEVDDTRIEALLWGLMLIDHRKAYPRELPHREISSAPPLPREYALLKLLFLPDALVGERAEGDRQRIRWRLAREGEKGIAIAPEPRILPLLRAGRISDACHIAYRRLRASGLVPLPGPRPGGEWRESNWEEDPALDPQRLAAALLLPIDDFVINQLVHLVTRQEEVTEATECVLEGENES